MWREKYSPLETLKEGQRRIEIERLVTGITKRSLIYVCPCATLGRMTNCLAIDTSAMNLWLAFIRSTRLPPFHPPRRLLSSSSLILFSHPWRFKAQWSSRSIYLLGYNTLSKIVRFKYVDSHVPDRYTKCPSMDVRNSKYLTTGCEVTRDNLTNKNLHGSDFVRRFVNYSTRNGRYNVLFI